ncbi:MAG: glutamate 5-kinase, partial [Clostridia bacterium]|nr:glutamate 5-kinase [Clostridia bacterium]
ITKSDIENEQRRTNLENTFEKLFEYGAVPIINENDSVATEEIVYGDNDSLSAIVARLIHADALIILSDIDGLFDDNPNENPDARLIPVVSEINDEIKALCGEAGTSRGTGGMITKIHAAEIAVGAKIPTVIMNGEAPQDIYKLIDGHSVGTIFLCE